jgi:O-antigen/teichoic acid export membrane protein
LYAVALVGLWAAHAFTVGLVLFAFFGTTLVVFLASVAFLVVRVGLGRPSSPLARDGLRYGLRLQGHTVGFWANARLDVMMLPAFVPARFIGLYAVATSMSAIVVGLFGSLKDVVFPAATSAGDESGVRLVERSTRLVLVGATLGSLCLAVAAPIAIPAVYGGGFKGAVVLLDLLLPGTVFWAGAAIVESGLQATNRPGLASAAQLIGMAVTVVGLVITVPTIGVTGAAITSSVAYTITFVAAARLLHARTEFSIARVFSPAELMGDARWLLHRAKGPMARLTTA